MTITRKRDNSRTKRISQKDLLAATNIVPNNPEHSQEAPDDEELGLTLYDSRNHRIWEKINQYRPNGEYYKTVAGHYKRRDEPGERDSEEVRRHNQYLAMRQQIKKDAREKLKKRGIVPVKKGKPMWEQNQLSESAVNDLLLSFRALYFSPRTMRFNQWLDVVVDLIDKI